MRLKEYFDCLGDEVGIFLTYNFVKKQRSLFEHRIKTNKIKRVFKNGRVYEYNNKKSRHKRFTIECELNNGLTLGIPFVIEKNKRIIAISAKDAEYAEYKISKSDYSIKSPFSSKKLYIGNSEQIFELLQ